MESLRDNGEPTHLALLSDAGSGTVMDWMIFFLMCLCSYRRGPSDCPQCGEDDTIHSPMQQHKGAHPKKTTIHPPEQAKQLLINLVRAAGCMTKLLMNRQTAQFVNQH